MWTQSGNGLLSEMLSRGAISREDFDRLKKAFQREKLLAVRGVSCTCTALERNVTKTSPVTPGQLPAVYSVFDTPELLEWILTSLSAFELLPLRGVCKYFREMVDSSPKIRRAMFRREALKTTELTLPPYGVRGVACQIQQVRGKPRISACIDEASYSTVYRSHLRKSSVLQSVLLAQPPPKLAVLYRDCKCVVKQRKSPHTPIQAETGLTFGHMFRTMVSMGRCTQCDGFSVWRLEAKPITEEMGSKRCALVNS
jgi:hypothetical protein